MICPHCAFPNDEQARLCRKCRRGLQAGDAALAGTPVWLGDPDDPPPAPEPAPHGWSGEERAVHEALAEARAREAAGDLRGAFLTCQSLVIDRFGSLAEERLIEIYLLMGRVSLAQDKWERARKYLLKARSLAPATPGLAELVADCERRAGTSPAPAVPAQPEPDDAFETPEENGAPVPGPSPGQPSLEPAAPPEAEAPPEARALSEARAPRPPAPEGPPGRLVWAAGFWARFAALALDLLLLLGLLAGMVALGALVIGAGPEALVDAMARELGNLVALAVLFCLLLGVYLALFTRFGGQTLGKMLLAIRVVRLDGGSLGWAQTLRRLAGMWLAGLPGLAGFLWAGFDLERRGWHDRVGGTLVVRVRPPRAALQAGTTEEA